jgi:hypothetical protein
VVTGEIVPHGTDKKRERPDERVRTAHRRDRSLDACADGTCEVFVQTGDSLPNASGAGPVQITVEVAGVSIAHTDAGGFSSTLGGPPGSTQQIGNQVFEIVAVAGTQGVLRLRLG